MKLKNLFEFVKTLPSSFNPQNKELYMNYTILPLNLLKEGANKNIILTAKITHVIT